MALAGVIIGSIALVISIFAGAVAAYQLQRYWRFRKPVFSAERADFPVEIRRSSKKNTAIVGPGNVVINARGASRTISCHKYWITSTIEGGRVGLAIGVGSPQGKKPPPGVAAAPYAFQLPPEVHTRWHMGLDALTIDLDGGLRPPDSYTLTLVFETPEEEFPVTLPLRLTTSGDSYLLEVRVGDRFVDRMLFRRRGMKRWLPHPFFRRLLRKGSG